jgi:hypothetical protein
MNSIQFRFFPQFSRVKKTSEKLNIVESVMIRSLFGTRHIIAVVGHTFGLCRRQNFALLHAPRPTMLL